MSTMAFQGIYSDIYSVNDHTNPPSPLGLPEEEEDGGGGSNSDKISRPSPGRWGKTLHPTQVSNLNDPQSTLVQSLCCVAQEKKDELLTVNIKVRLHA